MSEPKSDTPNKPQGALPQQGPTSRTLYQERLDQFMMAILKAEVQRKGVGLSQGGVADIKKLAKMALMILDNEAL